jgi:hypothetical protein
MDLTSLNGTVGRRRRRWCVDHTFNEGIAKAAFEWTYVLEQLLDYRQYASPKENAGFTKTALYAVTRHNAIEIAVPLNAVLRQCLDRNTKPHVCANGYRLDPTQKRI